MRRLLQARPLLRLAGEGGGGRPRLQVGERHQNPGGAAGAAGVSCPATPSSDRARGHTVGRRRQAISVFAGSGADKMMIVGEQGLAGCSFGLDLSYAAAYLLSVICLFPKIGT